MQRAVSYEEAISRKYPEQVAIAIARDAEGKLNPITLGWVMCTSGKPPMMAISVGKTRHSLEAIRKSKAFVLALPSTGQGEEAMFYGSKTGADIDKLAKFKANVQKAAKVEGVILSDAVANFECELAGELETGDHVIFAGRVVAAHVNTDASLKRLYTLEGGNLGGVREGK
jgi:flavin reductase (DIM6/NTAB) family NADH-FMN oxidoreductase RutF